MRHRVSALAYRWMYRRAIIQCAWRHNRFEVRTRDGTWVYSEREFDPAPLAADFEKVVFHDRMVAMDVGANIGAVTCWLARKIGPGGLVVAFEPDPENLAVLRRNLALNHVSNVRIIEQGAWETAGELEFHAGGGYTSSFCQTSYVAAAPERYRTVKVPVTTIDQVAVDLRLPRLDLIKMDIEGGEGPALRGAIESLRRWRPTVIVESHVVEGRSTVEEIVAALRAAGYDALDIHPDPETSVVVATPTPWGSRGLS